MKELNDIIGDLYFVLSIYRAKPDHTKQKMKFSIKDFLSKFAFWFFAR